MCLPISMNSSSHVDKGMSISGHVAISVTLTVLDVCPLAPTDTNCSLCP